MLVVLPLAYIAQEKNHFVYGSDGMHSPDSAIRQEQRAIEAVFDPYRPMLILVPAGDPVKETALGDALLALPEVKSLNSYAHSVGVQVPEDILPPQAQEQFREGKHTRLILSVNTQAEGPEAFRLAGVSVRDLADKALPGASHLIGKARQPDLENHHHRGQAVALLAGILAIGRCC